MCFVTLSLRFAKDPLPLPRPAKAPSERRDDPRTPGDAPNAGGGSLRTRGGANAHNAATAAGRAGPPQTASMALCMSSVTDLNAVKLLNRGPTRNSVGVGTAMIQTRGCQSASIAVLGDKKFSDRPLATMNGNVEGCLGGGLRDLLGFAKPARPRIEEGPLHNADGLTVVPVHKREEPR
jgi:hypothetical protein